MASLVSLGAFVALMTLALFLRGASNIETMRESLTFPGAHDPFNYTCTKTALQVEFDILGGHYNGEVFCGTLVNEENTNTPPIVTYPDAAPEAYYTYMFVDPDAGNGFWPEVCCESPILQHVVGNIKGSELVRGSDLGVNVTTLWAYNQPRVISGSHRYGFFLWKQPRKLSFKGFESAGIPVKGSIVAFLQANGIPMTPTRSNWAILQQSPSWANATSHAVGGWDYIQRLEEVLGSEPELMAFDGADDGVTDTDTPKYECTPLPLEVEFFIAGGHYNGAVHCGTLINQQNSLLAPKILYKRAHPKTLYLYMLVEPDSGSGFWPEQPPSVTAPVARHVVANIPGSELLRGTTLDATSSEADQLLPYTSPHLAGGSHRYGFFLYEQPSRLDSPKQIQNPATFNTTGALEEWTTGSVMASNFMILQQNPTWTASLPTNCTAFTPCSTTTGGAEYDQLCLSAGAPSLWLDPGRLDEEYFPVPNEDIDLLTESIQLQSGDDLEELLAETDVSCMGVGSYPWTSEHWEQVLRGVSAQVTCSNVTFGSCESSSCTFDNTTHPTTASCACDKPIQAEGTLHLQFATYLAKAASYCDALYQMVFQKDAAAATETLCGAIERQTLWEDAGFAGVKYGSFAGVGRKNTNTAPLACETGQQVNYAACMGGPCKDSGDPEWPLTCSCHPYTAEYRAPPSAEAFTAAAHGCTRMHAGGTHPCGMQRYDPSVFNVSSQSDVNNFFLSMQQCPFTGADRGSLCPAISHSGPVLSGPMGSKVLRH